MNYSKLLVYNLHILLNAAIIGMLINAILVSIIVWIEVFFFDIWLWFVNLDEYQALKWRVHDEVLKLVCRL